MTHILTVVFLLALSLSFTACSKSAQEEPECKGLGAKDCFDDENCRGIYGPSECCEPPTCDPPICTDDIVFYRCVKLPSGEVEQARRDRALCEKTQGAWRRGSHLEPGRCDCPSYAKVNSPNPELYHEMGQFYFIKDRGCIPARTLCEEMGGIWKKPDIAIVEKRKDISKGNCVTAGIYTVMEWDEENDLCVLSRINDPNPKCLVDGEKVDVGKLLHER